MLRKVTGGWRFLLIYAIGFVAFALMYTAVIYGRIQPHLTPVNDHAQVYEKMWSLVGTWCVVIFVAMLAGALITFPVRNRLMAKSLSHGRREVWGAFAAIIIWLAVSLIAVPLHLYVNWLRKYADVLVNGERFYGPSPEYLNMYLLWFVLLAIPTLLVSALLFRWRKLDLL